MPEWITANWIWLLLALGVGWFLLRRGGAGCGMGGHGRHHEPAPGAKELERGDDHAHLPKPAGSTGGSRCHRGCC